MSKRLLTALLIFCIILSLSACKNHSTEPESPKKLSEIILSFGEKGPKDVYLNEKLTFAKRIDGKDGNSWSMQGGANDGKFGYFVMNEHPEEGRARSRIYKIDLSTWEIVLISGDLDLGHANDVTYMPKNHQLVVTLCEAPADGAVIVDADTLEIVNTVIYPQQHPCMTYCPELDRYVFSSWGNEDSLTIYNGKLEKIMDIEYEYNFAVQCLTCDEDLIYFLQSPKSGGDKGYIFVFNWEGDFLFFIQFKIPYEVENISVYGDKFILTANDHHNEKVVRFYELSFIKP